MKVVFWDIETTPRLAWVWGRRKQYIPYENIKKDWFIICALWAFDGSDRIYTAASNNGDDKNVVLALYEMFKQADVLVHHNGDKFDYKRVVTRGSKHGLGPPKKPKLVDTLKQARKHFDLTSNKIAEYFGLPRKQQVAMSDFIACAEGDAGAIKKLIKYNRMDVKVQKEIYNRLKPYIDTPNVHLYHNLPEVCCPSCGSANTRKEGYSITLTGKYQRYQCIDCNKWSTGRNAVKTVYLK